MSDGTVSSIIEFGERGTTLSQKIDFAKNNYISTSGEFNPQLFTCMDKDTENKNPKTIITIDNNAAMPTELTISR